ncbi:MAG: ATP-binding protein [Fervidicoccaceae archaeon]
MDISRSSRGSIATRVLRSASLAILIFAWHISAQKLSSLLQTNTSIYHVPLEIAASSALFFTLALASLLVTRSLLLTLMLCYPPMILSLRLSLSLSALLLGSIALSYTTLRAAARLLGRRSPVRLLFPTPRLEVDIGRLLLAVGVTLMAFGVTGLASDGGVAEIYGGSLSWLAHSLVLGLAVGLLVEDKLATGLLALGSPLGPSWFPLVLEWARRGGEGGQRVSFAGLPSEWRGLCIGYVASVIGEKGKESQINFVREINKTVNSSKRWVDISRVPLLLDLFGSRNPHLIIFGESGSGKSTLAKLLAKEAARRQLTTLIVDLHGEYGESMATAGFALVDASKTPINPLDLDGFPPHLKALELSFSIANVFSLGGAQRALLMEAIERSYEEVGISSQNPVTWSNKSPTLEDLLRVLDKIAKERPALAPRAESLRSYMRLLAEITSRDAASVDAEELLSRNVVLNLSGIPHEGLQSLYLGLLLRKIYAYKTRLPDKPLMLIIDEAHRALVDPSTNDFVVRLVAESRKYKLALVLISQSLVDFDERVLANVATRISFRVSGRELERAVDYLAPLRSRELVELLKSTLRVLPRGYALISGELRDNLLLFEVSECTPSSSH